MNESSILHRSSSGIANQHLFFDVDLVIYCEGGGSYNDLAMALREGSDETHDASFWRAAIEAARPAVRVHVKSVGSKSFAQQIALAVAKSKTTSVHVCVDADFDHCSNSIGPQIPQTTTWGYSWEADLCSLRVLECVFYSLRPRNQRTAEIVQELRDWHCQFLSDLAVWARRDFSRVSNGMEGLYDRSNAVRGILLCPPQPPVVDADWLENRYEQIPVADIEIVESCRNEVERFCFGKHLIKAFYHGLMHFVTKARRGKIDFDSFLDLAINCFQTAVKTEPRKMAHYRSTLPT